VGRQARATENGRTPAVAQAWWHAVGPPLERPVRRRWLPKLHSKHEWLVWCDTEVAEGSVPARCEVGKGNRDLPRCVNRGVQAKSQAGGKRVPRSRLAERWTKQRLVWRGQDCWLKEPTGPRPRTLDCGQSKEAKHDWWLPAPNVLAKGEADGVTPGLGHRKWATAPCGPGLVARRWTSP
jgi:hypothetical protein